jgi:hypothetical protein
LVNAGLEQGSFDQRPRFFLLVVIMPWKDDRRKAVPNVGGIGVTSDDTVPCLGGHWNEQWRFATGKRIGPVRVGLEELPGKSPRDVMQPCVVTHGSGNHHPSYARIRVGVTDGRQREIGELPMMIGVGSMVSCNIGFYPVLIDTGGWVVLHRLNREVAHHPSDMHEPPMRIPKSGAVQVSQLKDTVRAAQRLVLPPIADDVKDSQRRHWPKAIARNAAKKVFVLPDEVVQRSGLWRA